MIPKNNWGGAYIDDQGNRYSAETLVLKDGFGAYEPARYDRRSVKLVSGSVEFSAVFESLRSRADRPLRGIGEIDVEGYEHTVIKELAATIAMLVCLSCLKIGTVV